ncbi:diguanylate cyclase domain-containing protein [uncultured Desulfuromonas sp.]|uniref:diguanylate cyclase domain-containing protein n=1 Tax=uncultured Desulfuromonas sp. TaxID=181013 RepID=UPI00374C90EF
MEKRVSRPRDGTARYGGEEFIALRPETDDPAAAQVAEKIRIQVQHVWSAMADHITVSLQQGDRIDRMV